MNANKYINDTEFHKSLGKCKLKPQHSGHYGVTPNNPSSWKAEVGRSRVQGQPKLHSKTPTQKTKNP
jgi:hypothetical protein